jgi:hypothetical protein
MKKIVALVLAAAALAVPATQANAATSSSPTLAQFKALQKQVTSLQAQVRTLQKWVPTACTTRTCYTLREVSTIADVLYAANVCELAVISDEFQQTWNVVDQISAGTPASEPSFGPQAPVSDKTACSALQLTRSTAVPPSVVVFNSLITLLTT